MTKKRNLFFALIMVGFLAGCGTTIIIDDEDENSFSSRNDSNSESSYSNSSYSSSSCSSSSPTYSELTSSYSSDDIYGFWDHSQDKYRNGDMKIEMLNFNDFHGAVEYSSENQEPGINKLSTYIKQERQNYGADNFLLTSSGDMWQGSCDSNLTKGRLVTDWMNLNQFDAMCIGNHEFDWGVDTILNNDGIMNFPLLNCNIYYRNTNQLVEWVTPFTTVTKHGLRIGIIGAIGEGQTVDILSSIVKDYKFVDPNPIITTYANFLRDNGADIVVCLLHDSAVNVTTETADAVDAIFCGHSHSGENVMLGSNGQTPAVQAYSNGKDAAKMIFLYDFDEHTCQCTSHKYVDLRSSALQMEDDEETANLYQDYLDSQISVIKDRVVGYTPYTISRDTVVDLLNKYLYKWFMDSQYAFFPYDLYRVTHNNARSDIPAGDITYGDIYKALPFDNCITLCKILGSNIPNAYYGTHFYPYGEISINNSSTYYILTIDYISESTYSDMSTIASWADTFPRDIMSSYIGNDYPIIG